MLFLRVQDCSKSSQEASMRHVLFAGTATLLVLTALPLAKAKSLSPSPEWVQALPSGPVVGTRITEGYATLVAREGYFWAWPLVNVYNRRLTYEKVSEIVMAGREPGGPLTHVGVVE